MLLLDKKKRLHWKPLLFVFTKLVYLEGTDHVDLQLRVDLLLCLPGSFTEHQGSGVVHQDIQT